LGSFGANGLGGDHPLPDQIAKELPEIIVIYPGIVHAFGMRIHGNNQKVPLIKN
jgi:hypothetical protein